MYTVVMRLARVSNLRSLKAIKSISWLTARQLGKLAGALTATHYDERSILFDEGGSCSERVHVLLSGTARITCVNRKGQRTMVIMVPPGIIPAFPTAVTGVSYQFRCEAVTSCRVGTMGLNSFVEICLGIAAAPFQRLAANCLGRWDRVQLRCANFMSCTLMERLALVLLDLSDNFGIPNLRSRVRLSLPVRHSDLAQLIGATRPRVTEYLTEFARKDLISWQRRHLVVDREGLETFLRTARTA